MLINADFAKRAVVHASGVDWVPSPVPGVDRKMLDRVGGEVARATSIVRYAPGSRFPAHTHGGGEEFLVLEGVFQDEFGDYPADSYIRNPPTSRHTPGSAPGCTIFVKLHQFEPTDRTQIRLNADQLTAMAQAGQNQATTVPLFSNSVESVRIEQWPAGTTISSTAKDGLEALVLEGSFREGGSIFERYSWLRLPVDSTFEATAGIAGAKVWIKSGHLRNIRLPALIDSYPTAIASTRLG